MRTENNAHEEYNNRTGIELQGRMGILFSDKDGESHCFELCEKCYDMIVADFMIPVEITERTELL